MSRLAGYFGNIVITEICKPQNIVAIGSGYEAMKINTLGAEDSKAEPQPFLICHPVAITLRVETWLGDKITWPFPGGSPYPMPLRRILSHGDNSITENIKIGY